MDKLGIDNISDLRENSNEIQDVTDIDYSKLVAQITVVGVGGGGCNMVSHLIKNKVEGINMIAVNTDAKVLKRFNELKADEQYKDVKSINSIQIGKKLTKGLGAGMNPEKGKESALEDIDEIKKHFEGQDIIFIATGLGGGTGSGASSVVVDAALASDALTITVSTLPFMFEGKKRKDIANNALKELKESSNSIIEIQNDKLLEIEEYRKLGLSLKDSFKLVDDILARAVIGTVNIILSQGEDDINVDFNDLKTIMQYKGSALMGIGEGQGEDSSIQAITQAIQSPLLSKTSIQGSMGILVYFEHNVNYPLEDVMKAMTHIHDIADENAMVIFGTSTNSDFADDFVKITIIATGFENFEKNNQLDMIKKNNYNFLELDNKIEN